MTVSTNIIPIETVRYVPALTGVRAVASWLVFWHHYNPAPAATFAYSVFEQGYIGVSIFFVLSGFLIYHRYADTYFNGQNWSWRRYLQNRFTRIFPLYGILLLITFLAAWLVGKPLSLPSIGLNLSLLKGFSDTYKFSGIAQSWSLTVELCFYGIAPLLFITLRRWGVFGLTTSLTVIGFFLWATIGQRNGYGFFATLPFTMFYTFFGRCFEFIVGMWLARQWQKKVLKINGFATYIGLLIFLLCVCWQADVTLRSANETTLFLSELVAYNYVAPVGIGLFFWGLLHEKSLIRSVLAFPIMQMLGRSSYAFYLIHLGVFTSGLQRIGITNAGVLFVTLLGLAYGLYVFVEKPLYKRVRS